MATRSTLLANRRKADWNLPRRQPQWPHAVRIGKSAARQLHHADAERRGTARQLPRVHRATTLADFFGVFHPRHDPHSWNAFASQNRLRHILHAEKAGTVRDENEL